MRHVLLVFTILSSCGGSTAGTSAVADGGGGGKDAPSGGAVDGGGGGDSSSGGGDAGSSGGGDAGPCHIDPPGTTFTFHVHNGSANDMSLAFGCGGDVPIMLDTPGGTLGIGPAPADGCEITCASQYAGPVQQGCSDCGPGVGEDLPAGGTVDITWDRRVYVAHVADPQCVGGTAGVSCALAQAVTATATQQGALTVCNSPPSGGYCGASSGGSSGGATSKTIAFTVDLTKSEATIEVQ